MFWDVPVFRVPVFLEVLYAVRFRVSPVEEHLAIAAREETPRAAIARAMPPRDTSPCKVIFFRDRFLCKPEENEGQCTIYDIN